MAKQVEYYKDKQFYTNSDGLTSMQRKFCEEYLKDENGFDATKAAKAAGFKYPMQSGYQTLHRKSVQKYLEPKLRNVERELQVDLHWKVKKLSKLINDTIPDDVPITNAQLAKVGLDGIAELNKMQGDIAPVVNKNFNANINMDADPEILDELIKQYEREY
jgi:phage terminase small subunit